MYATAPPHALTSPGHRAWVSERGAMTQFQLDFRYPDGDWSQIRKCNTDGEPHINGQLIVDGHTYAIKDVEWLCSSDDIGDSMKRFLCTLVVDPTDEASDTPLDVRWVRS